MSDAFILVLDIAALLLLVTLLTGLVRVFRGPEAEDRMLAGQLFGTTGVGILLVLAVRTGSAPLRDVALVLALLAIVTVSAFVDRVGQPADEPGANDDMA